MKCLVCGHEIREGEAECFNCGFPVLVQMGNSADAQKRLQDLAEQYRIQLASQYTIGVIAYSHTLKDNRIVLAGTSAVPLARADELSEGSVSWLPEQFVKPSDNQLEFTYYIQKAGDIKKNVKTKVSLPDGGGDIQIGVTQKRSGVIAFCVGTPGRYVTTEEVDIYAVS